MDDEGDDTGRGTTLSAASGRRGSRDHSATETVGRRPSASPWGRGRGSMVDLRTGSAASSRWRRARPPSTPKRAVATT